MRSRTVHLPAEGSPRAELLAAAREVERPPDFILAFLPPEETLRETLAVLTSLWPDAQRFGCEAVTQFAGADMISTGSVQLFWLDDPRRHHVAVEVIPGTYGEPPPPRRVEAVARRIAAADGVLLLVDGLRFPAEKFLAELRRTLVGMPSTIAGGLASQREPVTHAGARVFCGDRILPSACLAVTLHGVSMRVEVVRGWTPASPVYIVTRAEGNVVREIDGEPATDWYRRFFTIHGELAPLPGSSYRFPLIVEGPRPERQGLYRSMRFFDDPPGAVTFWGDFETGDRVRLGMGHEDSLVRTASELIAGPPPDAAILYSCVGRESVLGGLAGQEVAMIHKALGGAALSGFFTFGEIGPTPSGHLAYYNQTAILVLLLEAGA
ncbi:MAG TPA: FIST N-terminal domain-containing protein [Thermoanaerobaculia bacterium]|nr:FIST N-terminal domain-containing protein [Thermoanaerobaculia bacterium]